MHKIVPQMTYDVSSGTLNYTIPYDAVTNATVVIAAATV